MDSALKQRVLGAVVLIALAVIFVPMFISTTPRKPENSTQNLNIPPAPERNFETRNLALDEHPATPAPSAAAAAPAPAAGAPPASGVVRADGDKVATVNTGAPPAFEAPEAAPKPAATQPAATPPAPPAAAKPQPAAPAATLAPASPPAPAASADGRFLVNLGVYADAGHASALVEKVKKLGYPAFAESTEFQGKAAQRVRVGPYPDRAAAENVRLKIKQADAKVPSSVVQGGDADKPAAGAATAEGSATRPAAAAPPAPAAPTPTLPANRAGAYVVQVGAFKSEEEANKVRDRLRNGGVAAFIDKSGDAEQTLWKVRAGPYADRGSADAAVAALKQKFQLPGIVKTQP